MNLSKDLMAASSTPLVLSVIAEGETYGYEIVKRVAELSNGQLEWTDGMLYPLLHRLEQQQLLSSRWRVAEETKRKRKYYRITEQGQKALQQQQQQWQVITQALRQVWGDRNDYQFV
ncbi:PadR family transcriptional regulator [Pseudidiomarina insulisalsae]|uniref:PadR family transcriptional regulator n=1 Tax=Pseudidiomarina insulisalsae TaxID=575789 RepID=A0A432YPS8_9GAMM|nr:PadR family transcriptional regulator [Pseudidiomarina insulisalsae]RUO63128.1 PadR family transcriptional regulator [Pseudidiomarina insulisalsae]